MSKKFRKVLALMLSAILVFSLAACSSKEEKKTEGTDAGTPVKQAENGELDMSALAGLTVGFSQCDNASAWRIAETESIQETAKENDVTLVYADAGGDIAKQASDIGDMIAQGVDYIIAAPQEEDGLQSVLQEAMDEGIGVILVDRGVNGEAGTDYTTAIMSDFIWEAEQVAKKVIESTEGKGNVVILQGTPGATSATERNEGFLNTIKDTELKVIVEQPAGFLMAEAQSVMENILQAQGDEVDVVFCHNDDMALGALTAIKAAGYKPGEDILVCGIDGAAAALEAVKSGEMLCTASCSPYFGPITFETIAKLKNNVEVDEKLIIEDTLFDINNADPALGY
ncbi:MAG: substrate-binding domain-containing protein [Miniphocaeibacter sp.]|uniref:ABC transporter substrate-binding protein n=1 Tax=Miniphocaeibacter sp. TaxID=3100973 RepID=UPI001799D45D|nr:substrate-binding domain-containing protein [Gallicola sp.]